VTGVQTCALPILKKVIPDSENDVLVKEFLNVSVRNYFLCGNCIRQLTILHRRHEFLKERCHRYVRLLKDNLLSPSKLPQAKGLTPPGADLTVSTSPCKSESTTVTTPAATPSKIPLSRKRIATLTPTPTPTRAKAIRKEPTSKKSKRQLFADSNNGEQNIVYYKELLHLLCFFDSC